MKDVSDHFCNSWQIFRKEWAVFQPVAYGSYFMDSISEFCVVVFFFFQVPQRTTSISPALARKNSPGNGSALGPRLGSQPIRAR